ncbi:MAG: hypothetical protein IJA94_03485 [Bacilli bacterium]|nr:hypothetical protein [Bacilli bacterium]
MEKDLDFLNYMYKNAQMGIIGIDNVIGKVKGKQLKTLLEKQRVQYEEVCNQATELLKKEEADIQGVNTMARVSTTFMANMELSKEPNDSCIAKMMIEGTNKGIIEINEKLNNIPNIPKKIVDLAKRLLKTEQNNLEELKKYL